MTLVLKAPDATLDYAVDWGAEYLQDDELAQSAWDVEPVEAGGVTVVDHRSDLLVATVKAGGGVPGHLYRLTNRIVLASGLTDRRSIMLRVEKR